MPNFSIPLSGLTADATALSAIANNLANQNTTGYKDVGVQFSDLFYENLGTSGAGDPIQVGAGTKIGSMPGNFTQGSVEATGVPTDVAIQGNGFFAVLSDGVTSYTRAGDFSVDQNNFLLTSDGQQVLGYPAVDGVVDASAGVGPLQLGAGTVSPATATTAVEIQTNLNASAAVGDTLFDAADGLRFAWRQSHSDLHFYQHRPQRLDLFALPPHWRLHPSHWLNPSRWSGGDWHYGIRWQWQSDYSDRQRHWDCRSQPDRWRFRHVCYLGPVQRDHARAHPSGRSQQHHSHAAGWWQQRHLDGFQHRPRRHCHRIVHQWQD